MSSNSTTNVLYYVLLKLFVTFKHQNTMTNELPFVRGGYTFKKYTVAGQDVTLTIPQDPDQLLDDENVIAKSTTSGVMPYWASMWPAAEPGHDNDFSFFLLHDSVWWHVEKSARRECCAYVASRCTDR